MTSDLWLGIVIAEAQLMAAVGLSANCSELGQPYWFCDVSCRTRSIQAAWSARGGDRCTLMLGGAHPA